MTSIQDKPQPVNYRKIWTTHHGRKIPRDEQGRSYEIHHIDGNPKNNDITNLRCVSLQEHYDIHWAHGDYGACLRIGIKLGRTGEEISHLATLHNLRRVEKGIHPFKGGKIQRKRIEDGTHNLVGGAMHRKLVAEGIHNFLGGEVTRRNNKKRIENGTHNLLGPEHNRRMMAEGKSSIPKQLEDGTHPSQQIRICPHCNKTGKGACMVRWHFDFCKKNPNRQSREILTCPHCNKSGANNVMERWHFDNCTHNPTGSARKLVTCPHCSKTGGDNVMKRWHFAKCSTLRCS